MKNSVVELEKIPLADLVNFQNDMKALTQDNYLRLRREIEETGFSFAVHVWKHKGKANILDGHQRVDTLKRMAEEGALKGNFLVPCVIVDAKDFAEAKRKCLSAASQFGQFSMPGLMKTLKEAKISVDKAQLMFNFPKLGQSVFDAGKKVEFTVKDGAKELDASGFSDFDHKCPKCGFEYDDEKP